MSRLMKVQVLYDASDDGVISGNDLQDFFMDYFKEYSISGKEDVNKKVAKVFLKNSLMGQKRNSPSLAGWVDEMIEKYSL